MPTRPSVPTPAQPDIEKWLSERERKAEREMRSHEDAAKKHQAEAEKFRVEMAVLRRLREELPGREALAARPGGGGDAAQTDDFDHMPTFDAATDPNGTRKAVWTFLDEKRGNPVRNADIHRALVERGELSPDTPVKKIEALTYRMVEAKQIERAGRGLFWLPPAGHTNDTLLDGDHA